MDGEGRPDVGRGPCTGHYQLWARDGWGRQGHAVHAGDHAHDEAEYLTLLAALADLANRITGAGRDTESYTVTVYSGRELVVEQLTGGYRVKAPTLQGLHEQSCAAIARFKRVDLIWKRTTALKRLFRL
jgi:ribonuclease HI